MLIDIIIFYFVSSELNQTIEPGTVIAHIPTHYQAMNKRVSLPASLSLKLQRQGRQRQPDYTTKVSNFETSFRKVYPH